MIALFCVCVVFVSFFPRESFTQDTGQCPCTTPDCTVTEKLKVGSLCATSICINGQPVPPGDPSPCVLTAIGSGGSLLKAPVRDCCQVASNCTQWAPANACISSICVIPEVGGFTHGACVHTKVQDGTCCTCAADCPKIQCKNAVCTPTAPSSDPVSITKVKRADGSHDIIHPYATAMTIPGTCTYTDIPNCCVTPADCECDNDEFAVCGNGQCQCMSTCSCGECKVDSDCPPLDPELQQPGACLINACVGGICQAKSSTTVDVDGDGFFCPDDCDDSIATGSNKHDLIYCTLLTKAEIDKDNDGHVLCGADVEPLCLPHINGNDPVCPDDRVEVPLEDLNTTPVGGIYHVCKHCDLCDDNTNGEDITLYCAVDADEDGLYGPKVPNLGIATDISCENQFCSPVKDQLTGDATGDAAILQAACATSLGISGSDAQFVHYFSEPITEEQCENCDTTGGSDENLTPPWCAILVPGGDSNGDPIPACLQRDSPPGSTYDYPTALEACCAEIKAKPVTNPPNAFFQSIVKCCDALAADKSGGNDDAYLQTDADATCPSGDATQLNPLDGPQCDCPANTNEQECAGQDKQITCVFDKDKDCYFDCTPVKLCMNRPKISDLTPTIASFCNIDVAALNDDTFNLSEEQLCCLREQLPASATNGWTGLKGWSTTPDQATDFCDCNDNNKNVHETIVCFDDLDGDGFPACDDGKPKCTSICAASCPANKIVGANVPCAPVLNTATRRRNVVASLNKNATRAILDKISSVHKWFTKRNTPTQFPGCPNKLPTQNAICETSLCPDSHVLCDCQDADCVAYPGSPYAAGVPRLGSDANKDDQYDYNCDGCVDEWAACSLTGTPLAVKDTHKCSSTSTDAREIFEINSLKADTTGDLFFYQSFCDDGDNTADHDPPFDKCCLDPMDATKCSSEFSVGWEYDPTAKKKKRSTTFKEPSFCVDKDHDETGAAGDVAFNDCARFGTRCTFDTDVSDCGVDIEVCLKIGH